MAIDNKNLDKTATFLQIPVALHKTTIGASVSDVEQMAFRAPFKGKIVAVHVHAVAITDTDDLARVDVKNATTSVLSATINPTAGSWVGGTLKTDGSADLAAGDKIGVFVTTGAGDSMTDLNVTVVIRPLAGDEAARPSA